MGQVPVEKESKIDIKQVLGHLFIILSLINQLAIASHTASVIVFEYKIAKKSPKSIIKPSTINFLTKFKNY